MAKPYDSCLCFRDSSKLLCEAVDCSFSFLFSVPVWLHLSASVLQMRDVYILVISVWKWSEITQSCPTLCNPVNCSPPGSSVLGILQPRILEWVAISFSRGTSQPRNRTQVSYIAGRRSENLWIFCLTHLCWISPVRLGVELLAQDMCILSSGRFLLSGFSKWFHQLCTFMSNLWGLLYLPPIFRIRRLKLLPIWWMCAFYCGLMFIFQMNSSFFIRLLAIRISSHMKWLFKFFAHFF